MTNKEIKTALQYKRDMTSFARFIGISTRALYSLLESEKIRDRQHYNFIQFILAKYKSDI